MQIKPEALPTHLKQKLLPLYFTYGNAPLLVEESTSLIKSSAKERGFTEWQTFEVASKQFDWDLVLKCFKSPSLFSPKIAILLKLGDPEIGASGSKGMRAILEVLDSNKFLLITAGSVRPATQKTVWFQAISKKGVTLMHWPVTPQALPGWISDRAKAQEVVLSHENCTMLAETCDGNLLAAKQEIDKLALLEDTNEIQHYFLQSSQYSVFSLQDAILRGNPQQCYKVISILKGAKTAPSLLLWAFSKLLQDLTDLILGQSDGTPPATLMPKLGISRTRQPLFQATMARISLEAVYEHIQLCNHIDKAIKTGQTEFAWQGLLDLAVAIAV